MWRKSVPHILDFTPVIIKYFVRLAIHLLRNAKNDECILRGILRHFFGILRLFFRFLHFALGSAFTQKLEGFCGLFFRGINKTRNLFEMRKCIVSVSYFAVCFAKTFAKYPRNAKYKKCIAGLQ